MDRPRKGPRPERHYGLHPIPSVLSLVPQSLAPLRKSAGFQLVRPIETIAFLSQIDICGLLKNYPDSFNLTGGFHSCSHPISACTVICPDFSCLWAAYGLEGVDVDEKYPIGKPLKVLHCDAGVPVIHIGIPMKRTVPVKLNASSRLEDWSACDSLCHHLISASSAGTLLEIYPEWSVTCSHFWCGSIFGSFASVLWHCGVLLPGSRQLFSLSPLGHSLLSAPHMRCLCLHERSCQHFEP